MMFEVWMLEQDPKIIVKVDRFTRNFPFCGRGTALRTEFFGSLANALRSMDLV